MLKIAVLLLLSVLSLGAWSDPPDPSSGNENSSPQEQRTCEHTNTPYDYEAGTPCRPFFIKIDNTPQTKADAAPSTQRKDDHPALYWGRPADFWAAAFTFLLVVVGAVTAGLLLCQTRYLGKQIRLSREEFIASNRPRLKLRRVQIRVSDSQRGIEFVLINTGRSEATITECNFTIHFGYATEATEFLRNSIPLYDASRIDLGEQKRIPVNKRHVIFIARPDFTPEKLFKARSISGKMYFFGWIKYRDVIGAEMEMGFFRTYAPGTGHRFIPSQDPDYEYS